MNFWNRVGLSFSAGASKKRALHFTIPQVVGLGALLLGLSVFMTIILVGYSFSFIPAYQAGDIAKADITVPTEITVIDQEATKAAREAAAAQVLSVYRFDPGVRDQSLSRLAQFFAQGRALVGQAPPGRKHVPRRYRGLPAPVREKLTKAVQALGIRPPVAGLLDLLVKEEFNPRLEGQLARVLSQMLASPVLPEGASLKGEKTRISMQNRQTGKVTAVGPAEVMTLDQAKAALRQKVNGDATVPSDWPPAMVTIGEGLLAANLQFDKEATRVSRIQAAGMTDPVMRELKKGRVVVRRGDEISAADLEDIKAIRKFTPEGISAPHFLMFSLLVALYLFGYGFFLAQYHPGAWNFVPLAGLCSLILGVNLLVLRVIGFISESLSHSVSFLSLVDQSYFFYLMPFTFGAMNVALLAGTPSALLFLVFYGPLAGQTAGGINFYGLSYILVTNLVAIGTVRKVKQRIGIIGSGFKLGLAAAFLFLVIQWSRQADLGLMDWLGGISLSFLSGLINAGFLAFTLPLLEGLFRVATESRLRELEDINLPLMQQLISRAPGTYNHSLAVGLLGERAAQAISLSPLFLRVSGLYHDIGKSVQPEYYVENQQGENPHDSLSPAESVRLLKEHISEGIRMARKAHLPPAIIAMIPQHHGTRLIQYFYEKARQQAGPGEEIAPEPFRYDGPKPQTRAAAILMLADGIEAAARTLKSHSPEGFRNVIRSIISKAIEEGQLTECDITLTDLDRLAVSFAETLSSFYHNRISYPGYNFEQGTIPVSPPIEKR
jgi:cyclic-di-AMP phosphodiesterase PgpH